MSPRPPRSVMDTTNRLWEATENPPHLVTEHPSLRPSTLRTSAAGAPFWLKDLVENAPRSQSRRVSPSPARSAAIPTQQQQRQSSSSSVSMRTHQSSSRASSPSPSRSALASQKQQLLKSKQAELAQAEANFDQLGRAASEIAWERYNAYCEWRDRRRAKVAALEAELRKSWSREKAESARNERSWFGKDDVRIQQTYDRPAAKSPQWADELARVRTLKGEIRVLESDVEAHRRQLLKPSLMQD